MNLYKNALSVTALATGAVLLSLTSSRTVHALGEQVICGLPTLGSAVDGVQLIDHAKVLERGGYPYQINKAGSYRLSGNLVVSAARTPFTSQSVPLRSTSTALRSPVPDQAPSPVVRLQSPRFQFEMEPFPVLVPALTWATARAVPYSR